MRDLLSLHGRTTVITGGGRGIGMALATAAADAGSNVAILDVLDSPSVDLEEIQSGSAKAKYYQWVSCPQHEEEDADMSQNRCHGLCEIARNI